MIPSYTQEEHDLFLKLREMAVKRLSFDYYMIYQSEGKLKEVEFASIKGIEEFQVQDNIGYGTPMMIILVEKGVKHLVYNGLCIMSVDIVTTEGLKNISFNSDYIGKKYVKPTREELIESVRELEGAISDKVLGTFQEPKQHKDLREALDWFFSFNPNELDKDKFAKKVYYQLTSSLKQRNSLDIVSRAIDLSGFTSIGFIKALLNLQLTTNQDLDFKFTLEKVGPLFPEIFS